jgi:putative Holliday junction resolvase
MARVLAVDPGEKRIGIAVSDLTATIAGPLGVIAHVSRTADAAKVARLALEQQAVLIVVGQPLDSEGEIGPAARKAGRFAEALGEQTAIPVQLWDETGSTVEALSARRQMGVKRAKRTGHLDEMAATVILQTFLDALTEPEKTALEGKG